MNDFVVDSTNISKKSDCYVIAEIGNNHMGSLENSFKLIEAAKSSGASAVKFQKRDNKILFSDRLFNSPYENRNSFGTTYGEHRQNVELSKEDFVKVKDYSKKLNITFFATPFDIPSAEFLNSIDIPAYKIASGDINYFDLIKKVCSFKKPIFLSTGFSDLSEIEKAHSIIKSFKNDLCIMHCVSSYPAKFDNLNLNAIQLFKDKFPDSIIGYSGHENGISIPIVAYVLGARVIEKHFTLDRTWKGTDQIFSITPDGLRKLVRDLKRASLSIGEKKKKRLNCEKDAMKKMRKKIFIKESLKKGEIIKYDNLDYKCDLDGIEISEIENVINKKTKKDLNPSSPITLDDLRK